MGRKRRGRGEGCVYQRANGVWVGAVSIGYGGDGKRKRRWVYAPDKMALLEKLTRLQAQAVSGELGEPTRLRVGQFLDLWLNDTAKSRVRPSTFALYSGVVGRHVSSNIGGVGLAHLRPPHVRGMLAAMGAAGASLRLQQIAFGVLHKALKTAVKDGSIPRNPTDAVDAPRPPRPTIQPLDAEQANRLLEAAKGDRLHALYVLALSVGMREGELFGLTWPNLNLRDGTLEVTQQLVEGNGHPHLAKPKTKSAIRQIDLPAIALLALREHRERALAEGTLRNPLDLVFTSTEGGPLAEGTLRNPLDLVFTSTEGGPLRRSNFLRRQFVSLLDRAGLFKVEPVIDKTGQPVLDREGKPKMRKKYPRFHDLRHTAATLALKARVPVHVVSRMLGHARPSITSDIYAHVLPGQGKEAAQAIDAVFAGASR